MQKLELFRESNWPATKVAEHVAESINIKKGAQIVAEIQAIVCRWEQYAERAKVPAEMTEMILENLVAVKF